jgi:hypothetical protein
MDYREINGRWRELHSAELHNLCSLPHIIRMTTSRRMRWAEYVACIVMERTAYMVLVGK